MTLFTLFKQGKATDTYKSLDHPGIRLLVPSNRISAFDVPMRDLIPGKGQVITHMTKYWLTLSSVAGVGPSHLYKPDDPDWLPDGAEEFAGKAIAARDAEMVLLEGIVRGYITGSAWREYREHGTMHGTRLPEGLLEGQQLPVPVFTPSTKEENDRNINFDEAVEIAERQFPGRGGEVAEGLRARSLARYSTAHEEALAKGIIILDTKFEEGFIDNVQCVCDEILTPDSSRFTSADTFKPGETPSSQDKEKLRQYLISIGKKGVKPPPDLPEWLIAEMSADYLGICRTLTGSAPALAA